MTAGASSIAVQRTLAALIGKRVAKANSTIGTSFTIGFAPLHWIPRRQSDKSTRWLGGYFSARTYLLFQFCDWRMRFGHRELTCGTLPPKQMDALLQRLVGLRLLHGRLSGLNGGVGLQFGKGIALSIRTPRDGDWWIGTRSGIVSLFDEGTQQ